MNKVSKIILMLLIVGLAISSYFFIKELVKNKKETDIFDDLQEIAENPENTTNENQFTDILENEEGNLSSENTYNLENIAKINSDIIGWIKIDGTNIDYPIMQNGDYYLHKDIYKNYSSHGTPYLAPFCNLKKSDNLIIYGHHMKDNSQLEKYKNYNFYLKHKYIKFFTIENGRTIENNYEVMIAFKTIAYSDEGFRYYNYTDFQNYEDYEEFVENCRNLEFYYTGVVGTHQDKYITLSTCEYSQKNGRMVVVAKINLRIFTKKWTNGSCGKESVKKSK